jgi:hypothetical protein
MFPVYRTYSLPGDSPYRVYRTMADVVHDSKAVAESLIQQVMLRYTGYMQEGAKYVSYSTTEGGTFYRLSSMAIQLIVDDMKLSEAVQRLLFPQILIKHPCGDRSVIVRVPSQALHGWIVVLFLSSIKMTGCPVTLARVGRGHPGPFGTIYTMASFGLMFREYVKWTKITEEDLHPFIFFTKTARQFPGFSEVVCTSTNLDLMNGMPWTDKHLPLGPNMSPYKMFAKAEEPLPTDVPLPIDDTGSQNDVLESLKANLSNFVGMDESGSGFIFRVQIPDNFGNSTGNLFKVDARSIHLYLQYLISANTTTAPPCRVVAKSSTAPLKPLLSCGPGLGSSTTDLVRAVFGVFPQRRSVLDSRTIVPQYLHIHRLSLCPCRWRQIRAFLSVCCRAEYPEEVRLLIIYEFVKMREDHCSCAIQYKRKY